MEFEAKCHRHARCTSSSVHQIHLEGADDY